VVHGDNKCINKFCNDRWAELQTTSLLSTNPRDFFIIESYVAFTVKAGAGDWRYPEDGLYTLYMNQQTLFSLTPFWSTINHWVTQITVEGRGEPKDVNHQMCLLTMHPNSWDNRRTERTYFSRRDADSFRNMKFTFPISLLILLHLPVKNIMTQREWHAHGSARKLAVSKLPSFLATSCIALFHKQIITTEFHPLTSYRIWKKSVKIIYVKCDLVRTSQMH
jgi:hypothetical protein